jgi:hypothetical protein
MAARLTPMAARATRAKPICVYCCAAEGVDREHVFPYSWYPDTTPPEVQRLTVPACRACNERFKRHEESVGHDLIMVADSARPEAAGVHERLSKSWRADQAKTAKEGKHRLIKANRIWRTMRWADPAPGGPHVQIHSASGLVLRVSPARAIEKPGLKALAEKFIRGLHFGETGELLGPLEVLASMVHDRGPEPNAAEWAPMFKAVQSEPVDQRLGPGFWYRRYHGSGISFWAFLLWGDVIIAALVKYPEVAVP